jgi:tetratricopeptide (TPR) repeat protein
MRPRSLVLVLGLAVSLLTARAAPAFADDAKPVAADSKGETKAARKAPNATAKPPGEPVFDPDNKTAISRYNDTILKGNGKYLARDFPGALDIYRSAIPLAPKSALAYYVVAETQLAAGSLPEAEASLTQAEANSDEKNAQLRAKILFLHADVKERQKRWDEAKTAWQLYADFATKHAGAGFAPSAASRLQALDDMLKQEKAYVAVRERIAAEKNAPPATPPPKK